MNYNLEKKMPRVRIELTTFRFHIYSFDYETDALTNCAIEAAVSNASCLLHILDCPHAQSIIFSIIDTPFSLRSTV